MNIAAKAMIPVVPAIVKALAECHKISQQTKSRLTIIQTTLEKILNYVTGIAADAVKYLICHVSTIFVGLFSFDVHNAMEYLPKIDADLAELTELVCKIEQDLEANGDPDDIIDNLQMAVGVADAIVKKLNNAVDKAQSENNWLFAGCLGGSTLVGGAAGATYFAAANAARVAATPFFTAMLQGTSIGALLGITAPPIAATVAAGVGIGLAVTGAIGAVAFVPYAINRTRIQAEAKHRAITLNAEIHKLKIVARKLLRTEQGKPREQEVKVMIDTLEKLEGKLNEHA